ncbi:unnamed protein product [Ectocarpus sp. 13 AM-2016]
MTPGIDMYAQSDGIRIKRTSGGSVVVADGPITIGSVTTKDLRSLFSPRPKASHPFKMHPSRTTLQNTGALFFSRENTECPSKESEGVLTDEGKKNLPSSYKHRLR